ncbi:MAG TPA: hypothetical protein VL651_13430, partial [Bacteroidia bacterium]|nr:hypothetical protein [Bacteroidia bacterium]
MRKYLLALFFIPAHSLFSQNGFQLSVQDGYMLPFASGKSESNYSYTSISTISSSTTTYHAKIVPQSFGSGNVTNLVGSYSWKNNFGIDAGIGYLLGSPFKSESKFSNYNEFSSIPDIQISSDNMTLTYRGYRGIAGIFLSR